MVPLLNSDFCTWKRFAVTPLYLFAHEEFPTPKAYYQLHDLNRPASGFPSLSHNRHCRNHSNNTQMLPSAAQRHQSGGSKHAVQKSWHGWFDTYSNNQVLKPQATTPSLNLKECFWTGLLSALTTGEYYHNQKHFKRAVPLLMFDVVFSVIFMVCCPNLKMV